MTDNQDARYETALDVIQDDGKEIAALRAEVKRLRTILETPAPDFEQARHKYMAAVRKTAELRRYCTSYDVQLQQAVENENEALVELTTAHTTALSRAREERVTDLVNDICTWAGQTFPNATNQTRIAHLRAEVEELVREPHDLMEIADVFILLVQCAPWCHLLDAVQAKLAINKSRQWGTPNAQGFVEHIKAAPQEGR